MTEFTVRLKTEGTLTRAEAYSAYGAIAEAFINDRFDFGLQLVSITDDVASAPAEPPAPKPARKPRGPNKAKIGDAEHISDDAARANADIERAFPKADSSMSGFLKRGA